MMQERLVWLKHVFRIKARTPGENKTNVKWVGKLSSGCFWAEAFLKGHTIILVACREICTALLMFTYIFVWVCVCVHLLLQLYTKCKTLHVYAFFCSRFMCVCGYAWLSTDETHESCASWFMCLCCTYNMLQCLAGTLSPNVSLEACWGSKRHHLHEG